MVGELEFGFEALVLGLQDKDLLKEVLVHIAHFNSKYIEAIRMMVTQTHIV
jgi:hypothetical protein